VTSLFVIGDTYGDINRLESLLTYWNPDKEKLIHIGNAIGKKNASAKVLMRMSHLSTQYGAVYLKGNQEEMFLAWLSNPTVDALKYYISGGLEIIDSYSEDDGVIFKTSQRVPEDLAQQIIFQHSEDINYLQNLSDFWEDGQYLFVPTGLNFEVANWRNLNPSSFRKGHMSFPFGNNRTKKIVVFGSIPTSVLHKSNKYDPWISPCETMIGLNGDILHGGLSHALKIDEGKHYFYSA
jgi:serine/threonine protein phosphatase 1